MPPDSWIIAEDYAGLQAQALGLAERAGLAPTLRVLTPARPWSMFPAAIWPAPLRAVGLAGVQAPRLVIGVGGVAAAVGAALRTGGRRVVHVQHPRMDIGRFDLVVVNTHDLLTGPNVIVTRTALHRVTPERLAAAAAAWAPRLAHLRRPLLGVLIGGSNGRFRLDLPTAGRLAAQLAGLARDGIGVALTPSRRTDPAVRDLLAREIGAAGGYVWDMQGDNPYFGLLGLADALLVSMDSVSMISEAVATGAPVMLARLPGRSRRIGDFIDRLVRADRVRWFDGRLVDWQVAPLDDTDMAAAALRQRLGF